MWYVSPRLNTKSCQVAPLLAVGRNGILVRGFGGQIPPTEQTASFEGQVEAERAMSAECPPALKAPPLAAGTLLVSAHFAKLQSLQREGRYDPRYAVLPPSAACQGAARLGPG